MPAKTHEAMARELDDLFTKDNQWKEEVEHDHPFRVLIRETYRNPGPDRNAIIRAVLSQIINLSDGDGMCKEESYELVEGLEEVYLSDLIHWLTSMLSDTDDHMDEALREVICDGDANVSFQSLLRYANHLDYEEAASKVLTYINEQLEEQDDGKK